MKKFLLHWQNLKRNIFPIGRINILRTLVNLPQDPVL
jgi:hypothetical protein